MIPGFMFLDQDWLLMKIPPRIGQHTFRSTYSTFSRRVWLLSDKLGSVMVCMRHIFDYFLALVHPLSTFFWILSDQVVIMFCLNCNNEKNVKKCFSCGQGLSQDFGFPIFGALKIQFSNNQFSNTNLNILKICTDPLNNYFLLHF